MNAPSRIERARQFLPIRSEAAFHSLLSLYDESSDKNDAQWQHIIGLAYNVATLPTYDPLKAHGHFIAAANLGWGMAANMIAAAWEEGRFGVIDMERARAWYKKAYDLGNGAAGFTLFTMMIDEAGSNNPELRKAAGAILKRSAFELRHPVAMFGAATVLCDRGLGAKSFENSKQVYEAFAGDGTNIQTNSYPSPSLCMALRCYLGLDVPRDLKKAANYARQVLAVVSSPSTNVMSNFQNTTQRLLHLILHDRPDPPALETVRAVHEGTRSLDIVGKQILDGTVKASDSLSNYLWAAIALVNNEGHRGQNAKSLLQLRRLVEMRILGVSPNDLVTATEEFGPLFNRRNKTGYPVPGCSLGEQELKEGVGELVGLVAARGEIQFKFRAPGSETGPLLTAGDVNVALELAFGSAKPIWPGLSIEPLEKRTADRPRFEETQEKVWTPEWLGHTLMGKTMYAADYWMGRLVSNPWRFADNTISQSTRALLRRIAGCGGASTGLTSRIMLHPSTFHRTWTPVQGGWQCEVHKMDMAVLGSDVVLRPDGTEDRNVNKNDHRFSAGHQANLVTREYDTLCALFPLFERARQLTALVYALNGLREKGFLPSASLMQRINTNKPHLTGRPPLSRQQRLVLSL